MRRVLVGAALALLAGSADAAPKAKHPAAKAVVKAPPKPLTPVEAALAAAHADRGQKKRDQYAADIPIYLTEGTPFRLEIGEGYRSSALIFYYEGTVKMSASPKPAVSNLGKVDGAPFNLIEIGGGFRDQGSWVGENAYGARRVVSKSATRTDALAIVSAPAKPRYKGYEFEIANVPGPTAKGIVENTRFIVEGKVAPLKTGKLTGCYDFYVEAKIDSPYEITDETCYVGARISRVAFVNKATGEVYREWVDDGKPPKPIEVYLRPSDVALYYPERARRLRISGTVTLSCTTSTHLTLQDCRTASETPSDAGFGEAAMKSARLYFSTKLDEEGLPVTVTVEFRPD